MTGRGVRHDWRGAAGIHPELTPLEVLDDKDVEALMRSARADLAKLSLELRALQHEAASAQSASEAGVAAPSIDLDEARELLRTGVEARLARRRVQRSAEIERAKRDAARRIADAEAEATALVDAARAELLRVIAGAMSSPAPAPSPAARRVDPPAARTARIMPDDDPSCDSAWKPATTRHTSQTLATEIAPPASPAATDPADWRLVSEAAPPPPPARSSSPLAPTAPALPAPPPEHPAVRPTSSRRPARWRGLLHADVLLPLIAVLIVAVVLLAWAA